MAIDEQAVVERFRVHDRESNNRGETMHRLAEKAFGFYSGAKQWREEDREKLRSEQRPALTLNHVKPIVDVVTGSEVTSRFSQKYLARTEEDALSAQNFTETVRYIRDKTNAEYAESCAFADAVKTGLGCCEIRQDYEDNPEGLQRVSRIPLYEIYPDPNAREINLLDSEYVKRVKRLNKRVFVSMFPDFADMAGLWAGGKSDGPELLAPASGRDAYEDPPDRLGSYGRKDTVKVTEYCFFEREPRWSIQPPWVPGQPLAPLIVFEKEEQAKDYQKFLVQSAADAVAMGQTPQKIPAVQKFDHKVYYKAFFAGNAQILDWGLAPLQKSGFPYKFITCFEEMSEEETTWFGLIRGAEGPQEAYNKVISQIVHYVSVNPKGVLGYETGAFADPVKARRDWAAPGTMVEFQPGGLARVKQYEGTAIPPGMDAIGTLMKSELPESTGVNINYLAGQVEDLRRTATSVVQSIQRQGMIVLSPPFDALRLFRKEMGKAYQEMIGLYWTEGRLVRLTNNQYAPYVKDWAAADYDIIVDEVATSPNQQMETWNALTQTNKVLEILIQLLGPAKALEFVSKIIPDLPLEEREFLKQAGVQMQQAMLAQQGQAPPEGGQPPQ